VVHRVLGQPLEPRRHRRAGGSRHPVRVLDAPAAPGPRGRGAFATEFRTAFPDLSFWGTADLIAEGLGLDDGVTVLKQLELIPET
jgi:hypothetical protein